jgi:hypothetical protein
MTTDQAQQGHATTASPRRVRLPRADWTWTVPLQQARRALAAATRSIHEVKRLVYGAEHGDWRSRRRAGLRLIEVPDLMDRGGDQVGIAAGALALVGRVVEAGAFFADPRAQKALLEATEEYFAVGQQLMDLSDSLTVRFPRLNDSFAALAKIVARWREEADARPAVAHAKPSEFREFLQDYLALAMLRLSLLRRRRSRAARVADAPRRISRGRAPPFALACPL